MNSDGAGCFTFILGGIVGFLLTCTALIETNATYKDGLHRGRREACQARGGEYASLNGEDVCIPKGARR